MKRYDHRKNGRNGDGHNGKNGNDWKIVPNINPYCEGVENGEVVLNLIKDFNTAFNKCVAHNIRCERYKTKENTFPLCGHFCVNENGRLIKPQKREGKFFKRKKRGNGRGRALYCSKRERKCIISNGGKIIQKCLICNGGFSCRKAHFVSVKGKKIPKRNHTIMS